MNRNLKIITLSVAFLVVIGFLGYYFIDSSKTDKLSRCLDDNEIARYKIDKKKGEVSSATIFIKDKETKRESSSFQIELPIPGHYHPIELHRCGVYAARTFGYNYDTRTSLPGYKAEIWKYDYSGNGESLVLLDEDTIGNLKGYSFFFSGDFRVDPQEKYLILEKSYSNKEDYALVIKDLKTKSDVFTLSLKEITDKYPSSAGNFGFNEWTADGKYFWSNIFDGADVLAFLRIEAETWQWEIFEAPNGTMGGDVLNMEYGLVTYRNNGAPWTGDADFDQMYREEWKKEGKNTHFYLYNLFTKKQTLLETFNDPTYFAQPQWLSDTELEYTLPSGEKKIYKIE